MNTPHTVTVTEYDYDTKETKVVIEDLSLYHLSHALKTEHIAKLLESHLNSYSNAFKDGEKVGKLFLDSHRTLQGCFVNWLLGCLAGIATEEYTDPRNEKAIETAKTIARLLKDGQLPLQPFI